MSNKKMGIAELFFGDKKPAKTVSKPKVKTSAIPSDAVEYKGYKFVGVKKSKTEGKKYDAIFVNDKSKTKTVSFGNIAERDYTQHKDKKMKEFYEFKNKDKKITDLMSAYALESIILWSKPEFDSGVKAYKSRLKEGK